MNKNFKITRYALLVTFIIFPLVVSAYHLLQPLPGLEQMPGESLLAKYLSWLFRFALVAAAFLAVLQITIAGIQMIFGGASETARTNAKQRIQDAIWGLVLALGSVLILTTISPQFREMKLTIPDIKVTVTKAETATATYECSSNSISTITNKRKIIATYESLEKCEAGCTKEAIGSSYDIDGGYACRTESVTTPYTGNMGTWEFDTGVEAQKADASDSLKSLLGCMRSLLSPNIGRISSISDSKYVGNLAPCNSTTCTAASCKTTKSGAKCPADCAHTCQSCHYGGGESGGKSQAVDFGDEENGAAIRAAAQTCKAGYVSKDTDPGHKDHIHVSTADCKKN